MSGESKNMPPSWHTTDVSWYRKDLPEINESARKILEQYSGISPDGITSHLHEVRTQAWNIFPYPSIGNWHFLHLGILQQPRYPEILERLQQGQKLLDVGCGFAQDLRQLVFDGAPAENVYGIEIEKPFVDLGYDLFLDRAKIPSANFLAADIFKSDSAAKNLFGSIDIIYASQFFHLWGWNNQVEAGKAVTKLLNPARRSLIVGYQIGAIVPKEHQHSPTKEGKMYLHDRTSLQKLWGEVGEATGTKWMVEAWLDEAEIFSSYVKLDKDVRRISFAIERME
ncbi:hypothetical protein HO133_008985 [Letharia lupina]|uniref:Methyltransferase type 11 domain-containing protein n=1 Tax=Letharia lupina TaxID=560253 RepID=A0A8H6CMT2_9LECA|nr:uncharacterized protein HO133_008985 [Letharia lupina]KAF6226119.1 hypothetical protein HO133_008985 [Letharia lupina]